MNDAHRENMLRSAEAAASGAQDTQKQIQALRKELDERMPARRDLFAMAAMQGWIATYVEQSHHPCDRLEGASEDAADIARWSVMLGDALASELDRTAAEHG